MKKILIATCLLSITMASTAYAADTYIGSFVEKGQQKVDSAINPLVSKERALHQQQQAVANTKQNTAAQQQAIIDKKKQQLQNQKDALQKQKNDLKDLFTIK